MCVWYMFHLYACSHMYNHNCADVHMCLCTGKLNIDMGVFLNHCILFTEIKSFSEHRDQL